MGVAEVVGGAEVGVVREATEGEHSGPPTVNNSLAVMVAMAVVAMALMGDTVIPLTPSAPMVEVDLMEHRDMIREVRTGSLLKVLLLYCFVCEKDAYILDLLLVNVHCLL